MEDLALDILDEIPAQMAHISPQGILEVFPNTSLVFLDRNKEDTVILSVGLHGNELTSFYVLQDLVKSKALKNLNKNLVILIGNVKAIANNVRFLSDQYDYNRIWLGGESKEARLAEKIKEKILSFSKNPFALIDIHNNTGKNPHYACVSQLKSEHISLASLFSRTLVFFERPESAFSRTFSEICPSVTLECGKSGDPLGIEKASQFVKDVLQIQSLDHKSPPRDVEVFHTLASMYVKPNLSIGFGTKEQDINFVENLEELNFTKLKKGFSLATSNDSAAIKIKDDHGQELTDRILRFLNGKYEFLQDFYPAMLTKNLAVIEQDCLGYLMRKIDLENL